MFGKGVTPSPSAFYLTLLVLLFTLTYSLPSPLAPSVTVFISYSSLTVVHRSSSVVSDVARALTTFSPKELSSYILMQVGSAVELVVLLFLLISSHLTSHLYSSLPLPHLHHPSIFQRIFPRKVESTLIRNGKASSGLSVCELGIFGTFLGTGTDRMSTFLNRPAGHLIRSKVGGDHLPFPPSHSLSSLLSVSLLLRLCFLLLTSCVFDPVRGCG